ncbi:hypothetical protein Tco_0072265 [Tanacetum coccineum]
MMMMMMTWMVCGDDVAGGGCERVAVAMAVAVWRSEWGRVNDDEKMSGYDGRWQRVAVVASGGVKSRVRESDGGDQIDRVMGRIFGVGRKSSPKIFFDGCGGGRRLPDIWEGEESVKRECV